MTEFKCPLGCDCGFECSACEKNRLWDMQQIAANMLRESLRDGWIMGEHPVRFLRGNDHG